MRMSRLILLMSVAIGLAGCADGTPSTDTISSATPVQHPVRVSEVHSFQDPPSEISFVVMSPMEADVELWFEGPFVRERSLAIMVLDPQGRSAAETRTADDYTGGALAARTSPVSETITLTAGTWRLVFEGTGNPTGHARIHSR